MPTKRGSAATVSRAVVIMLVLGLAGVVGTGGTTSITPRADSQETLTGQSSGAAPNIVFILTDDLSRNLVPYMSSVREMEKNGTTFRNATVTDSLCCPSRSSILTGEYPHNTKVFVNEPNRDDYPGGYQAFEKYGNQKHTYGVALDNAGYRTGFMGKYLNGYNIRRDAVAPGWDEWHVSDNGYTNAAGSYRITNVEKKGAAKSIGVPHAYMNDLLGMRARAFVDRAKASRQPFFLQISTFAPHQRIDGKRPVFVPARRDQPRSDNPHGDCGTTPDGTRYDCARLGVRRTPAFNTATFKNLDGQFRSRVRMVQSLNDQIIKLRNRLAENGQLSNTYIVFASDNGYHLGEHGLLRGKGSAYDHDTQIPLIVDGPGVRKNQVRDEIVQTVDLYPTFQQMAGLSPMPSDGHGLIDLLRGDTSQNWRSAALLEHRPQLVMGHRAADPDLEGDFGSKGRARLYPTFHAYNAIRTKSWLYVNYTDGERPELYDLTTDPGENYNVSRNYPGTVRHFNRWLDEYTKCGAGGKKTCWKAGGGREGPASSVCWSALPAQVPSLYGNVGGECEKAYRPGGDQERAGGDGRRQ
jgi:N-acetylglucosamine-6-sulfatase